MAQQREIETRIVSLGELLEIVAAIRALAASQMQQALRSLEAIRRYSETIREALSDAARMLPSDGHSHATPEVSKSGLIVFCSEHGMCGGFNEDPIRIAKQTYAENSQRFVLIAVGTRGAQTCRERGLKTDLVLPMATHCAGVTTAARRLATEVYRMLNDGRIAGLEVVYAQHANEAMRTKRQRLLPLEVPTVKPPPTQLPPLIYLTPRRLFDDIVAEYFFAVLENAAMQSFYSESLTRFRTMEAAYHNIENKNEELTKLARRLRQEGVTSEILDLISSAQALPFD
jgi:F-type H+-transporting ATPase subunit gamma